MQVLYGQIAGVDAARAEYLFAELRKEHALVSLESDNSLSYREDVRTPMLRLLAHEHPRRVAAIHRAAVEYYSQFDDIVSRAEEIYHRLMLDQPGFGRDWLESRWLRGVESRLGSSLEELPVHARLLLASQMSIELPKEAYAEAAIAEWESIFGRKAIELLRYGQAKDVPALLAQRRERTADSPLYAIEVRALIASGEHARARSVLQNALEHYPPLGNPGRLAELLWLLSQVESRLGSSQDALNLLWRLAVVARTLSSQIAYVQALTEELGIGEALNRDTTPTRRALADALAKLPDGDVLSEPSLIRLALVRVGAEYSLTIARLAPMVSSDLAYAPPGDIQRMHPTAARVLGETVETSRPLNDVRLMVSRALTRLYELLRSGSDESAIVSLLELIAAEQTTLAGSNLAGLEEYREGWELDVSQEVAA